MFNFEFLKQNFINTTGVLSTTINTSTLANLLDRDPDVRWQTNGYSSNTASVITFTPSASKNVSRIALVNHNLKDFILFYDGATANTFVLSGYNTTATLFTTNSQTNSYFNVATQAVTSISLLMRGAQTADTERLIGDLYIGDAYFRFEHNPSAKNYKPKPEEKSFKHEMSDGGEVKYFLKEKFNADIVMDYVSLTERANFRTVYKEHLPFVFVPYANTSSWDGDMYEVNWSNSFDFLALETESLAVGYKGVIKLSETPV